MLETMFMLYPCFVLLKYYSELCNFQIHLQMSTLLNFGLCFPSLICSVLNGKLIFSLYPDLQNKWTCLLLSGKQSCGVGRQSTTAECAVVGWWTTRYHEPGWRTLISLGSCVMLEIESLFSTTGQLNFQNFSQMQ